jgi:hypothetical protein
MGKFKIKWNDLLFLSEIEFEDKVPHSLLVSDELIQTISFLTGATRHDRKLLRCDDNGALLVASAWSNLVSVETDQLYPASETPDSFIATVPNKGVLVATSLQLVYVSFVRVAGGAAEVIYIPPAYEYWYPNSCYSVTVSTVPTAGGTASYVGITAFN